MVLQPSRDIAGILKEAQVVLSDLDYIVMQFPDSKNMPNLLNNGKIVVQDLQKRLVACFSYERDQLGKVHLTTIYPQQGMSQTNVEEETNYIRFSPGQEISDFASISFILASHLGKIRFVNIDGEIYIGTKGNVSEH